MNFGTGQYPFYQNYNYNNGFPSPNLSPNLNVNLSPQSQSPLQQPIFMATVVSNIAEVNSTPADATGKPLFFYNKSKEEIYIKQYDNTGSAPIKTYKLITDNENAKDEISNKQERVIDSKAIDVLYKKIDNLSELLQEKLQENIREIEVKDKEKGSKNGK